MRNQAVVQTITGLGRRKKGQWVFKNFSNGGNGWVKGWQLGKGCMLRGGEGDTIQTAIPAFWIPIPSPLPAFHLEKRQKGLQRECTGTHHNLRNKRKLWVALEKTPLAAIFHWHQ